MKAVLLTGYGDVDQLQYTDAPDPRPGPGEVLIQVVSTSVNPVDYKIRRGALRSFMPVQFPAILGRDVAGKVVEVGPGVDSFQAGNQVMGLVNKSYAQYLVAKADELCRVPDGLDLTDAGSLPLVLITGAQLIEKGINPPPGQTVLITGAVGSVGRTAVYVAKSLDARVIAGVRGKQKAEAEGLGPKTVVALDDDSEIQKLKPFDAIADIIGGEAIAKLLPKWNRAGKFASLVGGGPAEVVHVWAQPDPKRLYALAQDVAAGKLRIPIARKLPLSEIREAHRLAESGAQGKIVLLP
ncbi:MAG TPA: NADP-dependent oxidoreductase [Rhizomicrobium sp.]|nr:NADP-dependent oxidoreductase [Rhizomicrobium sp.]